MKSTILISAHKVENNFFYFSRVKKVSIWKPEGLVVTVFKTFSAHIENQSYTSPSLQKPLLDLNTKN